MQFLWPTDKCEGSKLCQESNEHDPRQVTHLLALLLAEIANERLKILTFLFFDLQTSVIGQNGVDFDQDSNEHGQWEAENPNFPVICWDYS